MLCEPGLRGSRQIASLHNHDHAHDQDHDHDYDHVQGIFKIEL